MKYINRQGEEVNRIPDGFIKIDDDFSVEQVWMVSVAEEGLDGSILGEEVFDNEPTEGQIKYCLFKYPSENGEMSTYCTVNKIYRLVY